MKVEMLPSREKLEAELRAADNATLVAQQIAYIAAIDSLERLLDFGVTEKHCRWMVGQLRENLEVTHAIAKFRPNCALELEIGS